MDRSNVLLWAVDGPPVGVWQTFLGTADALMQDTLWLAPDGTGYLKHYSTMSGEEILPVMWQQPRKGILTMTMLLPGEDPNSEPEWDTFKYRCLVIRADSGGEEVPVLCNETGDQFWDLVGPISYIAPNPR
jgi:hypothetical protein